MVKVIALFKRRVELSEEEFRRRWRDEHPRHVRKLPGLRRYRQNHPVKHRTPWPYDGAAELWFESVRDVAVAFGGPEGDALRQDESRFIGEMVWFVVEEHEIPLSEPRP